MLLEGIYGFFGYWIEKSIARLLNLPLLIVYQVLLSISLRRPTNTVINRSCLHLLLMLHLIILVFTLLIVCQLLIEDLFEDPPFPFHLNSLLNMIHESFDPLVKLRISLVSQSKRRPNHFSIYSVVILLFLMLGLKIFSAGGLLFDEHIRPLSPRR